MCYSHILLTTWPRGSGREPITAASSSDGCSGFCRAFPLPPLAFFSRVLKLVVAQDFAAVLRVLQVVRADLGIDLLRMLCGAHRAAIPV
jgi:hypothetical protein